MAALTALQQMALEAPELASGTLSKNGYTTSISDFFQNILDTNGGTFELAMAQIFRICALEDRNVRLRLGEFEFERRTGMTFDDRRFYWEQVYRTKLFGQAAVAPTMGVGLSWIPAGPAIR